MVEAIYNAWFAGWAGDDSFLQGLLYLVAIVTSILIVVLPLMIGVAMVVYLHRKIWGAIQLRRGPNVVGPWGLLQSFADGFKLFLKETIIPAGANKVVFLIAPMITFTLALIGWAVIPWDAQAAISNINVGILYVLAISSLGVYGIIMSGWASNSR